MERDGARRQPGVLGRALLTLALGAALYLLALRFLGDRKALSHLARASPPLAATTLLLAAGSLLPYALLLQRWALRFGLGTSFRAALEATLAGAAAGRSLPAGGLANLAVQGWYLRRRNRSEGGGKEASAAAVLTAAGSYQGLLTAVGIGAGLTLPSWPGGPGSAALVSISCLSLSAAWTLVLASKGMRRRVSAAAQRFLPAFAPAASALEVADLRPGPGGLLRDLLLGTLRWLLEAGALAAALMAIGARPSPGRVLAAYALSNAAATLPLTPGGVGLVESSLALSLATWGLSQDQALAGVMAYRTVTFWIPWAVGLAVAARAARNRG